MSKTITKKILAKYFEKILAGEKTYELRLADWDCQPGDMLVLDETDNETRQPTGRSLRRKVGAVVKTKDINFWTPEEVDTHGYQVISLLEENDLPTIRIKNAWLLRESASVHLHKLWGKDRTLATHEQMNEIVENYQRAWKPYEQQLLAAMTNILGVPFRQNIVDVHVAPWFHAFSDPLVIGVKYTPDRFVDVLTHELLHRLLTDNPNVSPDVNMVSEWRRLFGQDRAHKTLVHIPVHAIHKAIYLDILKAPQRLARDVASDKKHSGADYVKSWEYVDEHGYKEIVEKLRRLYEKLGSS